MTNPNAVTTQYAVDQLERRLLLDIIHGKYRTGDNLPSTDRLVELTGCSRNTVRAAVGRLVSRGLLRQVPGQGIRIDPLLQVCDIELLLAMIRDKSDGERALELEAQLLDLMSIFFLEVGYRAAGIRTEDQMKWFNHYLRVLLDRVDQDTHVAFLAATEFQLMRVLADAGGSVAFTVLLNAFRTYLSSEAALELFPPETWQQLAEALDRKDVGRAREIIQRAFDRRTTRVLELLNAARASKEGGATAGRLRPSSWWTGARSNSEPLMLPGDCLHGSPGRVHRRFGRRLSCPWAR